ncbi:hypothetical protein F0562_015711 [Nyssa sinensis]|uniref:DC1 domain-containing protein n=1 Tax=Nyssa sinensis TaxID=561372 RepID=A0A5J4ZLT9_9ASTE|nr:hypothetical protein F0562_015711 [Nyssa sinensis]
MELEYIHEHPLIFYEAQKDDPQSLDLCHGCGKNILGPAYRCSQECFFHLHKLCAELPKQINYNQHWQHPLILLIKPPYNCRCNVCRGLWDKFTYHCSHCHFDLCISCALEEELDYHSHEHPLFLYEVGKGDAQSLDLCHGCGNGILGPAYHCSQQQCFFYLHKICAELPKKINHTLHPQHSLNLFIKPPYHSQTCECDVCQEHWDKFTYNCSDCDFNLCISCVLGKERRIKHESHEHPLDLLQRPTLFQCDACDTKSEDISYICTVCSFRIHKGCASLQSTIKNSDHDHPLTLAYSFPDKYLKLCKICSLRVRPEHWVYYCDICNYFAHVKCATSKLERVSLRRSKNKIKAEEDLDSNESDRESHLFHLPASPKKYVDMISQFNMKFKLEKNASETEVNHFSHDHPLILSDEQSNQDAKIDEILCDGLGIEMLHLQSFLLVQPLCYVAAYR